MEGSVPEATVAATEAAVVDVDAAAVRVPRTATGMDARHQAGPSREERQDQEHGGDLPALSPHQGVPDCRPLPSQAQGRGHEGTSWMIHPRPSRPHGAACAMHYAGTCLLRVVVFVAEPGANPCSPLQIKPVQKQTRAVSAPDSRPLSSLVTPRATLVWASRPPRKLLPPSVPPSSSPS